MVCVLLLLVQCVVGVLAVLEDVGHADDGRRRARLWLLGSLLRVAIDRPTRFLLSPIGFIEK